MTDGGRFCTSITVGGPDQGCTSVLGKDGTYTFVRSNGVVRDGNNDVGKWRTPLGKADMVQVHAVRAGIALLLTLAVPVVGSAQGSTAPAVPIGPPAGSFVLFSGRNDAFGSGLGTGTLTFQGQSFKFSADGLRPAKPSAAADRAEGTVYNLQSVNDFPGFFSTIVRSSGSGSWYLQNEHDVIIHITRSKNGVLFRTMDHSIRVDLLD